LDSRLLSSRLSESSRFGLALECIAERPQNADVLTIHQKQKNCFWDEKTFSASFTFFR
jgi:hypothetical protein